MKRSGTHRNSVYVSFFAFVLFVLLISSPAHAQQIITDGNTNTTLNTVGATTDVTTTTTKGVNAFNSFSRFNVNAGNTVNLVVPNTSQRLINIVKNEQTNINGILNSVQNGTAGRGNIYLVNPNGIVVGATGQVNVGALTAVTPTSAFVNTFFDSPGNPNDAAVTALINGTAPINANAAITNAGTITGQTRVETNSGTFTNTGTIQLSDVVNVDKIENGQVVGQYNGDVVIKTAGNLTNSGTIKADGASNLDAGNINLTATGNLNLNNGSLLSAKGIGANSDGGNILSQVSNHSKYLLLGDSSGFTVLDVSSDTKAGLILFKSDSFKIYNALTRSGSINGQTGNVEFIAINPGLTLSNFSNYGKLLSDGGNINILATTISTIGGWSSKNVLISSRNIANVTTGDHKTALSEGKSGNISLNADSELGGGSYYSYTSEIYAFGNNNFEGGNLLFNSGSAIILGSNLAIKTDQNININAYGSLKIHGFGTDAEAMTTGPELIAGKILKLNSPVGLSFLPGRIEAGIIQSDFLIQDGPLVLKNKDGVRLGNLDKIFVDNKVFNPSKVDIETSEYSYASISLLGNISTNGDFIANASKDISLYNANLNGGNINLVSSNITFQNSSLTSGAIGRNLLVNANNTIDPSSNVGATISGGNVNVDNVNSTSNKINIVANSITGSGSLKAIQGNQNVNITNNSLNNLMLNNINALSTGEIVVNGTKLNNNQTISGTTITAYYQDTGITNPQVTINNNSTSNIVVKGNITNSGNVVNLVNSGGNVYNSGILPTITGSSVVVNAPQGAINKLNFNDSVSTTLTSGNDTYISGKTGSLVANSGGAFNYNAINATSANINAGSVIRLSDGTISGNATIVSNAPAVSGPAEIALGGFNSDLAIGGDLSATATYGNIYYYGGSVGGNATFNAAEAFDNRMSIALGRYRNLTIGGNLNATTAGNMTYGYGSVAGNTTINASKLAGFYHVNLDGNLNVNAAAFGYASGTVDGLININAPGGSFLGADGLVTAGNNVIISSALGNSVYYLGNVAGNLNITAKNIVDVGNSDLFPSLSFTYAGHTYTIADSPVPITPDLNDLTIGGNTTIATDGLVNYSGITTGTLSMDGSGVTIKEKDTALLNLVQADNLVDITSENGSILDGRPTEDPNIIAKDVTLSAPNGTIGTMADDLNIDLLASTLNATAKGDINIKEPNSKIDVNRVQSTTGNVKLTAYGDILDVRLDETANVMGKDITLISTNGNIGSSTEDLDITVTGNLIATSLEIINLDQTSGTLNINKIYSNGSNIQLTASDINLLKNGILSSRKLNNFDTADHLTALSTGNSGNITLNARNNLTLNQGSSILSFATNSFKSGNVSLTASNDLTVNNTIKTDGLDVNNSGNINLIAGGNVNYNTYRSKITTAGDFKILANAIHLGYYDVFNANNILLNANYIDIQMAYFNAINNITINANDIKKYGLMFRPYGITCKSFNTNIFVPGENINLISNYWLQLANLDRIIVNGQKLTPPRNIYLKAGHSVNILGEITATGDITLIADNYNSSIQAQTSDPEEKTIINAGGSIILNGNFHTEIGGISSATTINAGKDIILLGHTYSGIGYPGVKTNISAKNNILFQNINNTNNKNALLALCTVDLKAGNNITLESNNILKLLSNSIISAGNNINDSLLVNNKGIIDPTSTINATVNNGNILLNDVNKNTSKINITYKQLNTDGSTLKVLQGNQNVNIINNSANNLILSNIDAQAIGEIVVNGSKVTNNIVTPTGTVKVLYQDTGITNPQVNINNNSTSNILLGGNITNAGNPVNIANTGGSILNNGASQIINASNIQLAANNGNIGADASPVNVNASGNIVATANNANLSSTETLNITNTNITGNLTATTTKDFSMTGKVGGNIITTAKNTNLTSIENINLNNANLSGNLTANTTKNLNLTGKVAGNIIATAANANLNSTENLKLTGSNITNNLVAYTAKDFTMNGQVGGNIAVTAYNVGITSPENVNINKIDAGNSTTITSINGSIFDANNSVSNGINYNIKSPNKVTLTALKGNIGGNDEIGHSHAINLFGNMIFKAEAGTSTNVVNNINIEHIGMAGSVNRLSIDSIKTNNQSTVNITGADVDPTNKYSIYKSLGFIDDTTGVDNNIDIEAKNINLLNVATFGPDNTPVAIGYDTRGIEIKLLNNGVLNAKAGQYIYIRSDGDMRIGKIQTTNISNSNDHIQLEAMNGSIISTRTDKNDFDIDTPLSIGGSIDLKASNNIGSSDKTLKIKMNNDTFQSQSINGDTYIKLEGSPSTTSNILIVNSKAGNNYNLESNIKLKFKTIYDENDSANVYVEPIAVNAGGNVTIKTTADYADVAGSNTTNVNNKSIKANGNITINSGGKIGYGYVRGYLGSAITKLPLILESGGSINLNASDSVYLSHLKSANDITVATNKGNIELYNPIIALSTAGNINTYHNVSLATNSGSILDNLLAENSNIIAKDINLVAGNGSIGTFTDDLNIELKGGNLTANALGYINIKENAGDLVVNRVSNNGNAGVKLVSASSILNGRNDNVAGIISKDLYLSAGGEGSIGMAAKYLNIDTLNNGKLEAVAKGGIYIEEKAGDMNLFAASTAGWNNVNLIADGSILDASTWENPNIYAKSINLISRNGSIASAADALNINLDYNLTGDAILNASANDSINISHDLNTANLLINRVQANNNVKLNSAASILDGSADELANITAKNIILSNLNAGSIGTFDNSLNVNLLNGTITAQSYGYIGLEQNNGTMYVDLITNAGRADVNLNVLNGSILDASPDARVNIVSKGLFLNTTPGGSIGLMNDALDIATNYNTTGGKVRALSRGYIGLNEAIGDLYVDVLSNAGRSEVNVNAAGSILNADTIGLNKNIYAQNVTLTSANGNIGNAIKPLQVYVNYNTSGGVLNATANNGIININQALDGLMINQIIAKDKVIINAADGIFTNTSLPFINITGNDLILGSLIQIGTLTNPIVVHASGTLTASAPKKYIQER